MIYSDPYKFIFLAIPKTGSRSIQDYLQKFGTRSKKGWDPNHDGYSKTMEKLGPQRQDYFKFAFFRNPWSLLISTYFYNRNKYHWSTDKPSIQRWIETYKGDPYLGYLFDDSGNLGLDFCGKLENIKNDLSTVCNKIGIDIPNNISHVGKQNYRERLHYTEYYDTPQLINRVKTVFSKSLSILKYEFDDAPR